MSVPPLESAGSLGQPALQPPSTSASGGARTMVIYKKGDDLRQVCLHGQEQRVQEICFCSGMQFNPSTQDQLVVQMFGLMDRLLKRENLDLKLTPYRYAKCQTHTSMI